MRVELSCLVCVRCVSFLRDVMGHGNALAGAILPGLFPSFNVSVTF